MGTHYNDKKPGSPIEGDSYYDPKINRVLSYSKGKWIEWKVYNPGGKAESRKKKISNLLGEKGI